jgi:anti-sigma-K factor RskA
MTDERTQELAALHALGLLEGAELAAFEAVLARDPELRRLVAELTESAAALAHLAPAAAPPSPALRERVLASIAVQEEAKIIRPAASAFQSFSLRALVPWAVAASLAVALLYYSRDNLALRSDLLDRDLDRAELRDLKNQLAAERLLSRAQLDQLRLAQQNADVAQLKVAALVSLLDNSPAAQAVAVWNPAMQEGVLDVTKLPALAADQDYQLWVVDPQYPNPVDGGVFQVDAAGGASHFVFRPHQPVRTAAKFAVSRERKGGVPKAEGPMVLLSN